MPAAAYNANQRRVSCAAQSRRRSLSLGGRRSTQALCVRAPCRAGRDRPMAHEMALPRLEVSQHLARACGATCQLRPPTPSQHRVSRVAQVRQRSLSLGGRRSTRTCCARALCRAGCGPPMPIERALRRRQASLSFRRAPAVRRASCGLQCQPMPRVLRGAGAPALFVSGGRNAALKLAASARRAALVVVGPWRMKEAWPRREASLLRRAPVVRRASCGLQRQAGAACLTRRRRAGARCLWGGGEALKLAACARCAALYVVGPYGLNEHCPGEKLLILWRAPVVRLASCVL